MVTDDDGDIAGVLKIANPAFSAAELAAQDAGGAADRRRRARAAGRGAADRTRRREVHDHHGFGRWHRLRAAAALPAGRHAARVRLPDAGGGRRPRRRRRPGEPRAGTASAIPGLDRILQWDLRFGDRRRRRADLPRRRPGCARDLQTAAREGVVADLAAGRRAAKAGGAHRPDRRQCGGVAPTGDVAPTASSTSATCPTPGPCPNSPSPRRRCWDMPAPTRHRCCPRSGHSTPMRPLSTAEAEALWPLLVLRTAVLIVSGAQQAALDPDNDYVTDQSDAERRMFEQATSVPMDVMTAVIKADLGLAASAPGAGAGAARRRGPGRRWSRSTCPPPPTSTTTRSTSRTAVDRHRGRIWPGPQCKTAPRWSSPGSGRRG